MILVHICEVCGKTETMDSEDAYKAGWDYPPHMGVFGVLSPRTCPSCTVDGTLWFRFQTKGVHDPLSPADLALLERVLAEPGSITP